MSQFDGVTASYLNSVALPIFLVIGLILVLKKGRLIHQWFFARLFTHVSKGLNRDMDQTKAELFKELQEIKSFDLDLRNKGLIRVLEIGVGPGSNFKFYPQNSSAIVVDPNPYFRQSFEEKSNQFPNVKLEKVIVGVGENLVGVKDQSVDVVIGTYVMCSVTDVNAALGEIKRVLAPGGKYFFMEHVLGDRDSVYYRRQRILDLIWPHLCLGCHITRDLGKVIQESGFSKVHTKKFNAPITGISKFVVTPHVMGTVEK